MILDVHFIPWSVIAGLQESLTNADLLSDVIVPICAPNCVVGEFPLPHSLTSTWFWFTVFFANEVGVNWSLAVALKLTFPCLLMRVTFFISLLTVYVFSSVKCSFVSFTHLSWVFLWVTFFIDILLSFYYWFVDVFILWMFTFCLCVAKNFSGTPGGSLFGAGMQRNPRHRDSCP